MRAKDIMSTPVISVGMGTPVREIAVLLRRERVSGVPVIEEGRLVGIVSESDLLRRHEIGTEGDGSSSWWLRFIGADPSPGDYVKSHATRARDVMTWPVVTVAEEASLAEVVRVLEAHRIGRVPVVHEGFAVGIVSRADIVRALAEAVQQDCDGRAESDEAIRARLLDELRRQPWWRAPISDVSVTGGVVHLWGALESRAERAAARVAAENVPGVRGVEDHRIRFSEPPWST